MGAWVVQDGLPVWTVACYIFEQGVLGILTILKLAECFIYFAVHAISEGDGNKVSVLVSLQ